MIKTLFITSMILIISTQLCAKNSPERTVFEAVKIYECMKEHKDYKLAGEMLMHDTHQKTTPEAILIAALTQKVDTWYTENNVAVETLSIIATQCTEKVLNETKKI